MTLAPWLPVRFCLACIVIYASIWIAPAVIVYPFDWVLGLVRGVEYRDGWTPGMMVWLGFAIAIPVVFAIGVASSYTRRSNAR